MQLETLNNIINFNIDKSIEEIKDLMIKKIIENTNYLIELGFEYQEKEFSLLLEDVVIYIGILNILQLGFLPFPYSIRCKDETEFIFNNGSEYIQFCLAVFERVNYIHQLGWIIRDNIKNCTTIEELQLIEDNRL